MVEQVRLVTPGGRTGETDHSRDTGGKTGMVQKAFRTRFASIELEIPPREVAMGNAERPIVLLGWSVPHDVTVGNARYSGEVVPLTALWMSSDLV